MWSLYDELIDAIPRDITVEDCCLGATRSYIEADGGLGVAMAFGGDPQPVEIIGRPLREIAALSRSWDFQLASLGVAAINAYHNRPDRVQRLHFEYENNNESTFTYYRSLLAGKKVAVVGHFYMIEQCRDVCELVVLEKQLQPGDLPDSACEFVLPEQDYVFITGSTMVNKTLPRLLQLSQRAETVLVGPSVPLSPILFRYGANVLAGTMIQRPDAMKLAIRQGGHREQFVREATRVRVFPE